MSDERVSDTAIGRSDTGKIRQIALDSRFGKTRIFVTDGHLPYPFGHERTGYGVDDLPATLAKATASGAQVLWRSTAAERRASALVRFPVATSPKFTRRLNKPKARCGAFLRISMMKRTLPALLLFSTLPTLAAEPAASPLEKHPVGRCGHPVFRRFTARTL